MHGLARRWELRGPALAEPSHASKSRRHPSHGAQSACGCPVTPEGRKFHARVSPLLEEAELAAAEVSGGKGLVTGHLRVSSDPPSARFVIAPSLPKLLAAHPGLSVEIVVREQLGDLVSEGIGCGSAVRRTHRNARGCRTAGFYRHRYSCSPDVSGTEWDAGTPSRTRVDPLHPDAKPRQQGSIPMEFREDR